MGGHHIPTQKPNNTGSIALVKTNMIFITTILIRYTDQNRNDLVQRYKAGHFDNTISYYKNICRDFLMREYNPTRLVINLTVFIYQITKNYILLAIRRAESVDSNIFLLDWVQAVRGYFKLESRVWLIAWALLTDWINPLRKIAALLEIKKPTIAKKPDESIFSKPYNYMVELYNKPLTKFTQTGFGGITYNFYTFVNTYSVNAPYLHQIKPKWLDSFNKNWIKNEGVLITSLVYMYHLVKLQWQILENFLDKKLRAKPQLLLKKQWFEKMVFSLFPKPIYITVTLPIPFIIYYGWYYHAYLWQSWIVASLLWVVPMALLWQTFMFLYKTYRISKYTNLNQKFWKRSLFMFWAIELFLFVIIFYLWINSPANLKCGVNHMTMLRHAKVGIDNHLESFVLPGLLVISCHHLIIFKKNNHFLMQTVIIFGQTILLAWIIRSEFYQMFEVICRSTTLEAIFVEKRKSEVFLLENWASEKIWREDLVKNHFKLLTVFLKFWHVVFIGLFHVFHALRFIEYKTLSHDSIGASLYNMTFLVWFNALFLMMNKKDILYIILKMPPKPYIETPSNLIHNFNDVLECYLLGLFG